MSKPLRTISAAQGAADRPSAWAQALFAGSLLIAGVAVWLLVSL